MTLVLVAGAGAAHAGTPATGFTDTLVVGSLSSPTAIAFLPDGTFVVTEKGGAVKIVSGGTAMPAGSISVCTDSEMGLLGVAVDPAFGTNGYLYFYRTEAAGGCGSASGRSNEVVRGTLSGGTLGPVTTIKGGFRTDGGNHDGGVLRIGPDGKLYVGVGDTGAGDNQGGPGSSTNPYSHDLGAFEGKVLRLELNGSSPADNPFVSTMGARPEIFAYGFRNPFRFGFDPFSGTLWVGDVGDLTYEEIDLVTAGKSYGWPECEAMHPAACSLPGDVAPIYEYAHGGSNACVTGGAFAVGGALVGAYFFGDYSMSTISQVSLNPTRDDFAGAPQEVVTNAGGPVDIVFGPDGSLYYVAHNDGEVRRVATDGFGPPTATTSTTTTTSSTTTTLSPAECIGQVTFPCARAALDALAAAVTALGDMGHLDDGLMAALTRAGKAIDDGASLAQAGQGTGARAALRRALRSLGAFRTRVRGGRRIESTGRRALADQAAALASTLRTLRRSL